MEDLENYIDKNNFTPYNTQTLRRGVEQLAARRAHNPEAAGSSPAPAIMRSPVNAGDFLF